MTVIIQNDDCLFKQEQKAQTLMCFWKPLTGHLTHFQMLEGVTFICSNNSRDDGNVQPSYYSGR